MTEVERIPLPDSMAAARDRDALIDAQVDLLALLERHPLGLDGDVALLSAAIAYISHHHKIDPDVLAFRAASPRGDRSLH